MERKNVMIMFAASHNTFVNIMKKIKKYECIATDDDFWPPLC